jgi:hypothetical protein
MAPTGTATEAPAAPSSFDRAHATLARLVKALGEATGIPFSFGYIGNCEGTPGTPAFRDDRSWFAFAAHPGRVGTHSDSIGGYATDSLDQLVPVLQGALALARVQNVGSAAERSA